MQETRAPSGAGFDKFLLALTGMGILVALMAIIAIVTRPAEAAGGAEAEAPFTAVVSLKEFSITGDLEVPAGHVLLDVVNDGSAVHNLYLRSTDSGTRDLQPGERDVLDLGRLSPGEFEVYCAIPGHEAAGMVATITVVEAGTEVQSTGGHGEDPDWAALDRAMTESMLAFPAETEGKGNTVLEPTLLADGTKEFEITAEITPWEVEPGIFVDAWTYNGVVPGPQIAVDLGDNVRVIVHNELPMGTDVHWHGIDTPNDMDGVAPYTQDLIGPGETFVYEFVADEPGVGMYHAHHHGQMQVPNGMFATFMIGDVPIPRGQTISGVTIPANLQIDQEIPMVLNDAGVIGYSLNGKSFPATEPYAFETGDWAMIHYYNEGLQIHPMHLHQFPQLVIAKDGIPLDYPYWVDTLNVAPGERYTVLINPVDPGVWAWHCHILTHVEREEGMFGMVTAIIVEGEAVAAVTPDEVGVAGTGPVGSDDHGDDHADHSHGAEADDHRADSA